jgi:hypothetical protein
MYKERGEGHAPYLASMRPFIDFTAFALLLFFFFLFLLGTAGGGEGV